MGLARDFGERAKNVSSWVSTFRNIWWLLLAVGAVVFFLLNYWANHRGVIANSLGAVAFVSTFALGGLAGWCLGSRRVALADYTWTAADYTYSFDVNDVLSHIQTAKINIKANRHNVQLFKNRYSWTGSGTCKLKVVGDQHKLLTELFRENWRYYYILLDHPLRKGASTTITTCHELYDAARTFQPLVAKDVLEPLGHLALRVVFPANIRPTKILATEMARSRRGDGEWQIVKEQELSVHSVLGEVLYQVERPIVGRRYQVIWSWSGYPRE